MSSGERCLMRPSYPVNLLGDGLLYVWSYAVGKPQVSPTAFHLNRCGR